MLVFLDLDGVLRREGSPPLRLERDLRARFEETLRALPGAAVVIASSWREVFALHELRARFSVDVRARIAGTTPHGLAAGVEARHREVLGYVAASDAPDRPWVAIDDQREHYPARANVRIVDPRSGFDEAAAAWLLGAGRRYGAG